MGGAALFVGGLLDVAHALGDVVAVRPHIGHLGAGGVGAGHAVRHPLAGVAHMADGVMVWSITWSMMPVISTVVAVRSAKRASSALTAKLHGLARRRGRVPIARSAQQIGLFSAMS